MNVEQLFLDNGALLKGHFLLSSGLHSDRYLQCALVLARPSAAEQFGKSLAALVPRKPSLVVSPAMGGLIIGQEVARALGVRHVFAERDNGQMTLRRGFALQPGERAVLVEDVITTGKSSGEVMALAASKGARVTAALSIVCRSAKPPELGVPVRSLLNLEIASYKPEACPLCKQGTPAVKPGSRPNPKL